MGPSSKVLSVLHRVSNLSPAWTGRLGRFVDLDWVASDWGRPALQAALPRRRYCVESALNLHMGELTDRESRVLERLFKGLVTGQRACLAESITLVETQHPRKKELAQLLLQRVLAHRRQQEQLNAGKPLAFRIGR